MSELYELPNGWEWKNLGNVTTELSSKNQALQCHDKPYLSLENIESFTGNIINYKTVKESNIIGTCSNFNSNSVIYSKLRPYLNKVATPNFDGVGTTELIVFLPEENLDKQYLAHFLRSGSVVAKIDASSYGAKMPRASSKFLRALDIPIPPLLEQQRIVSKLDLLFKKIDKSIELHQKNMDETNAFMGSVLNDVFVELEEKHSKKQLKDIVSKLGDGLHGTPKYDEAGEYYFINGANVSDNKIMVNQNTKKVNEEEYHKYKKELNNKTIFVSINGTLGNIGLYDNEKCILGKSACYFNLLDNIDKIYITYVMRNQDFQQYIRENATGATIKNVSLKTMREYNVVLPPLPIQQKVVEYLESVSKKMEKVKSIQKEKMESLKALKASILDKAFRGEL